MKVLTSSLKGYSLSKQNECLDVAGLKATIVRAGNVASFYLASVPGSRSSMECSINIATKKLRNFFAEVNAMGILQRNRVPVDLPVVAGFHPEMTRTRVTYR